MRSWVAIAGLMVAAAAATGFYAAWTSRSESVAAGAQIVHAERRTIASTVNATGTVRMRVGSEVRVGSQLSGIVKKLNVTVGSHVRAGEVIAEIDDAPLRARIADADAQVELDRASLQRAQVNYERSHRLASQGLIPAQQEEDLQLALQEARARWEKSQRDRDLVKVDLGYTQILSPISGIVASVSTQKGETVAASFTAPTFVTIIADHALELVAMVDETDIANVRPGNPVSFTVDSFVSREFSGQVVTVAPKATIVSGVVNYEVTINIEQDAELLKPDMTANVSIQTARHEALMLPAEAIQKMGDQSFVYLSGKNGPKRNSVVLGNKEGGFVEIKRGASPTDEVLLPGAGDKNK